jgi:UDP-N-acetylglucosamine--N-acetylmuramyl-(pentapeptide) pyrophosphoryl-undecaprenol N-acetylglucosamine transferase
MKILFTGGGTGGHIYPIVAVIRELKKKYGDAVQISYMGPRDNFCSVVLAHEHVKVRRIFSGKIRRYLDPFSLIQNAIDALVKVPLGVLQSFIYLFFANPDLVFSKGGYGSFPVAVSARILGIPVFLQESDALPGLASKKTFKYATGIFVSFPKTENFPVNKMILTGNPIRTEMLGGSNEEAAKTLGLKGGRPLILVMGGSQGAQRINDKILDALPELLKKYEIVHITGPKHINQVAKEAKITVGAAELEYYHPIGYADEKALANIYAASDLIVGRAGSGCIFEIAAVKKPSILIPLPESAQNHQVRNAYAYAQSGAALVIEENNFTNHLFLERIHDLLDSPQTMAAMAEAAAQFSRPNAAKMIAEYIVNYTNR